MQPYSITGISWQHMKSHVGHFLVIDNRINKLKWFTSANFTPNQGWFNDADKIRLQVTSGYLKLLIFLVMFI